MSILISLQVVGFWGNVPQNITGESKRPPLIISCFLHYKRYRSSQSDENHLLALCKLFSQLIQIKSFPLQSISSPDANYFLLCKLPCHPPWKLSSHPLQIIFSPGETILGFNEPDHDEHPLTQVSPLPLAAEVALWSVAEKAVEGWLQLQERYHDRLPR